MTKETFDRAMEHHNMLIIVPRDVSEAFEFVSDCIDVPFVESGKNNVVLNDKTCFN